MMLQPRAMYMKNAGNSREQKTDMDLQGMLSRKFDTNKLMPQLAASAHCIMYVISQEIALGRRSNMRHYAF